MVYLCLQGQIRIQKKDIKTFYQVKGYNELQLQEIDLRSGHYFVIIT